ncbi:VOC family protein [Streptomyces sp. NPDC049954]|uniref:VOC family protein n=1 Tax=Streptomyces sp. NPDC049954 TaxID=3155779 RepID=UPI003429564A
MTETVTEAAGAVSETRDQVSGARGATSGAAEAFSEKAEKAEKTAKATRAARTAKSEKSVPSREGASLRVVGPAGPGAAPTAPGAGRVAWIGLQCGDPESARSFYGRVLGWTFEPGDGPGALWRGLDASGAQVLTLGRSYSGKPAAGVWAPCFTVPDARAAAARVRESCGTVAVGPLPLEGGRGLLAADRQGAGFTLWEPGRDVVKGAPVARHRLYSPDAVDAVAFYRSVLAADARRLPSESVLLRGPERLLSVAPAPRVRRGAGRPVASRARWQPEFLVPDVEAAVASALAAGASLLVEDAARAVRGRGLLRAPDSTVFALAQA